MMTSAFHQPAKSLELVPFLPHDNLEASSQKAYDAVSSMSVDLSRLLRMPARDFWSHIVHDSSILKSLDCFLHFQRRSYDCCWQGQQNPLPSATTADLARKFFMLLLRMCSPGESGGPSEGEQGELLYECWLLDVPKLLDLATIYGHSNKALTSTLLENVFRLQPRYFDDLRGCVGTVEDNLVEMAGAVESALCAPSDSALRSPPALGEALVYFLDTAAALQAFLGALPRAAPHLLRHHTTPEAGHQPLHLNLLQVLTRLHDTTLPALLEELQHRPSEVLSVRRARLAVQEVVWSLLWWGLVEPADSSPPCGIEEMTSLLLTLLGPDTCGASSLPSLLPALNSSHRLAHLLTKKGLVDRSILGDEFLQAPSGLSQPESSGAAPPVASHSSSFSTEPPAPPPPPPPGASMDVHLASRIAQIRDMLPDLGEGFLARCLEAFDQNTEKVVHAVLEDNLPGPLACLDRSMPWQAPQQQITAAPVGTPAAVPVVRDKGKAKVTKPSAAPHTKQMEDQTALVGTRGVGSSKSGEQKHGSSILPPEHEGGGGGDMLRRGDRDLGVGRATVLGGLPTAMDSLTAQVTRLRADALQYEYDDEYDDSYDDLSTSAGGADAVCETEDLLQKVQGGKVGQGKHTGEQQGSSTHTTSHLPTPKIKQGPTKVFHVGKDGRIYNYKREDTEEIRAHSTEEIHAILRERKAVIHGLGAGGNVPQVASQRKKPEETKSSADIEHQVRSRDRDVDTATNEHTENVSGGGRGRGGHESGGRRGGGGRGRGAGGDPGRGGRGGRGGHDAKEKHKSSVANHHRKDRAAAKMNSANRGF